MRSLQWWVFWTLVATVLWVQHYIWLTSSFKGSLCCLCFENRGNIFLRMKILAARDVFIAQFWLYRIHVLIITFRMFHILQNDVSIFLRLDMIWHKLSSTKTIMLPVSKLLFLRCAITLIRRDAVIFFCFEPDLLFLIKKNH